MQPGKRARRALLKLAEDDPAFAALSLWINHRDDDETDLWAWSNSGSIHYGAAFEQLDLHEQISVAGHHMLHIAFRHGARARGLHDRFGPSFAEDLFNIGADALINSTLARAGYALPRPSVELEDLLLRSGLPVPSEPLSRYDVEALYLALLGRRGGADAEAFGGTAYAEEMQFRQDVRFGSDDANEGSRADEWQQHLARAMEAGKTAGRGIGLLAGILADLPNVRTPWEHLLRRAVGKALFQESSPNYNRPSRRWLAQEAFSRLRGAHQPIFEPALRRALARPRLAIGLDTSSSIDEPVLTRFIGELSQISVRCRAEIHLMVFDEAVQSHRILLPGEIFDETAQPKVQRGGGTSFIDVLRLAAEIDASLAVILTDLEGPAGTAPKYVPVLWATPQDPAPPAPFGQVISLAR
ncbi:MAG: VWA-like domain-containing protein [Pseudomonadota bacterium]